MCCDKKPTTPGSEPVTLSQPVFQIPYPLSKEREEFIYALYGDAMVCADDHTRGASEEARENARSLAHQVTSVIMANLDSGYYVMPHNEQTREMPNLAGELADELERIYYKQVNT